MAKKEWWQKMKEELDMSDLDNTRNNNKVFFGQLVFTMTGRPRNSGDLSP